MSKFTNQELNNYANRIKLSQEKKSYYSNQIDNLKNLVTQAINESKSTNVERAIRAGSWKKGTALAPKADYPLDVDMVFFLNVDNGHAFDAEKLRKEIITVLCNAYPNKKESDFKNGKKTIGITFRGTGLEVDIVPFIPEYRNSAYGYQPHKKLNTGNFKTSVDHQLKYIREIKLKNPNFTSVVRILKSWKNYQELEIPSFSIELVVAHLIETGRNLDLIQNLIINFFELLGSGRDVQIYFPNAIGSHTITTPYIADPTNNENNTLSQISTMEWKEVINAAENAFETISYAESVFEKEKTNSLWKEIFGPSFFDRRGVINEFNDCNEN